MELASTAFSRQGMSRYGKQQVLQNCRYGNGRYWNLQVLELVGKEFESMEFALSRDIYHDVKCP